MPERLLTVSYWCHFKKQNASITIAMIKNACVHSRAHPHLWALILPHSCSLAHSRTYWRTHTDRRMAKAKIMTIIPCIGVFFSFMGSLSFFINWWFWWKRYHVRHNQIWFYSRNDIHGFDLPWPKAATSIFKHHLLQNLPPVKQQSPTSHRIYHLWNRNLLPHTEFTTS